MTETWRPVKGYEGLYRVSSYGRVQRLPGFTAVGHAVKGRELRGGKTPHGHHYVDLVSNGKRKRWYVHRLVLEAFVGPPPEETTYALHRDDNPINNHLDNLRWGTALENAADLRRNSGHYNANKTHCCNGHEFSEKNTYIRPSGDRDCKECVRVRGRRYKQKKRGMHG